ncbi:MAG: hypothetical protein QME81_20210 [bacterium]|nr:hypothetical protein [bacterium]
MKIKKLISGMILMSITTSPVWAEESKLCRLKVDTSLRPITIAGIQESELIFRPGLLGIERTMSLNNTALYSASFSSEQSFGLEESKEKKTKGRIIGTIVGAGIGVGIWYYLSALEGLEGFSEYPQEKTSSLLIIVPTAIGGFIGYNIGDHYDKKEGSR